ncbi:tektin-1-like [Clinocottus analis]|uniref:tektin-1-like n=1 Tax=Clinocottus analis TaxID=304258 RepID=UPI0035C133C5
MSVPDQSPQQDDRTKLIHFEVLRNNSEFVRAECTELMLETHQTRKRLQNDDNKRLDQRVKDIQFLKKELELKLEEIIVEIDFLIAIQSRVAKALQACTKTLKVTVVCLEERKNHHPSERRREEVDTELLKEKEVGEGVASLLQRVSEQITEQIRLDRSAKYHLEKDLKDKFQAQCIDNSCLLMTQHSINNLQRSKNTETVLPSLEVTPKQWENFSDINIMKAEQQQANSLSLRALVESLLQQTAADLLKQVQATTAAFQLNVHEIKSTKSKMENQLAANLSEFTRQQRIGEDLQVAIAESEQALSLAQARLALRRKRPGIELCHDPAQCQLLAEVRQLNAHINTLHEAVAQSDEEQRSMLRSQLELQESIQIKANSLYIDEVICTQHREPIVIHSF